MHLIALLATGDEMLVPVFDPFDRAAKTNRQPGHEKIFRIETPFGPKATADPWRNHSDLIFRNVHELYKRAAYTVRPLARSPNGQETFFGLVLGDDAAGFDGVAAAPMNPQCFPNNMIRLVKRLLLVARRLLHEAIDVIGFTFMNHSRAGRQ